MILLRSDQKCWQCLSGCLYKPGSWEFFNKLSMCLCGLLQTRLKPDFCLTEVCVVLTQNAPCQNLELVCGLVCFPSQRVSREGLWHLGHPAADLGLFLKWLLNVPVDHRKEGSPCSHLLCGYVYIEVMCFSLSAPLLQKNQWFSSTSNLKA